MGADEAARRVKEGKGGEKTSGVPRTIESLSALGGRVGVRILRVSLFPPKINAAPPRVRSGLPRSEASPAFAHNRDFAYPRCGKRLTYSLGAIHEIKQLLAELAFAGG
jgi:hypothetical protein